MLSFLFSGRLPWLLVGITLLVSFVGGGYLYLTKLQLQTKLVRVERQLEAAERERDEAAAIAVANADAARQLGEQLRRQVAAAQRRESLALARARQSQRLLAEARRAADARDPAPAAIRTVVTK